MIDYYSPIFTTVAESVRAKVPGVYVTGSVSMDTVSEFPCVSIDERENTDADIDNGPSAPHARLTYRVTVLSNKIGHRITEARSILSVVDDIMQSLNFRRTAMVTQDGMYNNSAYQIQATYVVKIDQNGTLSIST